MSLSPLISDLDGQIRPTDPSPALTRRRLLQATRDAIALTTPQLQVHERLAHAALRCVLDEAGGTWRSSAMPGCPICKYVLSWLLLAPVDDHSNVRDHACSSLFTNDVKEV